MGFTSPARSTLFYMSPACWLEFCEHMIGIPSVSILELACCRRYFWGDRGFCVFPSWTCRTRA
ncbi:hypothetical protein L210DRAFT_3526067 [Boletus edulis BED1]|uniref:Uncharacterized protein n=1 Tax=Boletus edulis BED1 TaxID=1328754 RepID=A0AAD4GJ90_BOLED|nr:hypothetical protein L210DRAFT_3526067 [Boletus edulis BED1]